MKHGRRHNKLKEQTYKRFARDGLEGYHHEYRPLDEIEKKDDHEDADAPEGPNLAHILDTRSRKRLQWLGVDPEDVENDEDDT